MPVPEAKSFPEISVSRQWNWGDGLSGIRELLLQRIKRIRSAAGAHVEPRETRIFILIFYPGAAPVLRVLRILRSLRILRFCSRTELFAHPTPVTSYRKTPDPAEKEYPGCLDSNAAILPQQQV